MGVGANAMPWPLYSRESPGNPCTGDWVDPGPVWTAVENRKRLAPPIPRVRTPTRPVRSKSLYRLRHTRIPPQNVSLAEKKGL